MKPTALRQEVRKMRFEEAYYGWTEKRLSRTEAAVAYGKKKCPIQGVNLSLSRDE